jgi:hypothetical protein
MMRTTLTLDDDVARMLEALMRRSNRGSKAVVNEVLRAGFLALAERQKRPAEGPYRIQPVSLGKPRLPSLDNVQEVLAAIEGDERP